MLPVFLVGAAVAAAAGRALALSAPPGPGAPLVTASLMPPTNGHSLSGASNGIIVHTTSGQAEYAGY